MAGDPDEADFLWTDFSPAQLAERVTDLGTPVSPRLVGGRMPSVALDR